MYFSSVEMADEWDDDVDTGKTYSSAKFSNDDADNSNNTNSFGSSYGNKGRGGGRGGRGGGGGGFGRGNGRDGGDRGGYRNRNQNDDSNDDAKNDSWGGGQRNGGRSNGYGNNDDDENGRGRGGGRGRDGGGRGGRGGRRDDDSRNNDRSSFDDKDKDEKPKEIYIPPEPSNDESEIFGTGISSGINFAKYDSIKVKITGNNPPKQIESFDNSGLNSFLLDNIAKSSYSKPTPVQKYAIPTILQGRDLMACAQTGSGKTAAFLLPIINTLLEDSRDLEIGYPHVVIVSPTRELATQIYNEARKFALNSFLKLTCIYGGTGSNHQRKQVGMGCHILVATPGRLLDFVDKSVVAFDHVRFIVLDEADRMLDMGFLPDVEKVMNHASMVSMEKRQTVMFSATFPEEIQRLAGKFLKEYVFITVGVVGMACEDVEQVIHEVSQYKKRDKLVQLLEENEPNGTIVFVNVKRQADFLASFLSENTKFMTTTIHGDREQAQREGALRDFKNNKMQVIVATSVIARGLDIKNVRHVINFDMPKEIDEYVHRIGRTGRVGNRGKASSFYDPKHDFALAPALITILKQANQTVPEFLGLGGGGSSHNGHSGFGGQDVRRYDKDTMESSQPQVQENEEFWG